MQSFFVAALAACVHAQQFLSCSTIPETCLGKTESIGEAFSQEDLDDIAADDLATVINFDQSQSVVGLPVGYKPTRFTSCVNSIIVGDVEDYIVEWFGLVEIFWGDP